MQGFAADGNRHRSELIVLIDGIDNITAWSHRRKNVMPLRIAGDGCDCLAFRVMQNHLRVGEWLAGLIEEIAINGDTLSPRRLHGKEKKCGDERETAE